jgi:hypothetical protein
LRLQTCSRRSASTAPATAAKPTTCSQGEWIINAFVMVGVDALMGWHGCTQQCLQNQQQRSLLPALRDSGLAVSAAVVSAAWRSVLQQGQVDRWQTHYTATLVTYWCALHYTTARGPQPGHLQLSYWSVSASNVRCIVSCLSDTATYPVHICVAVATSTTASRGG